MITGSAAALIGGGIISFILFFVAFKINDSNNQREPKDRSPVSDYLVLFLYVLAFAFALLTAKAVLDLGSSCSPVVDTMTIAGNTTSYSYEVFCHQNTNNTNEQFYTVSLWGFGAGLIFIALHTFWRILMWAKDRVLGRKRG